MLKKIKQPVWDLPVRLLHWLLVATITASWISSHRTGSAHEYIGYGAGMIILLRLLWGFTGNRYARFRQFVHPAPQTLQYLREVVQGHAARYLGHNPLGGWMVVALLSCVGLLVVSGWLTTTDLLWGYAWPVLLHTSIAWTLIGLIALHISGVLFTSWQHHENLIAAMLTGKKTPAGDDDIK